MLPENPTQEQLNAFTQKGYDKSNPTWLCKKGGMEEYHGVKNLQTMIAPAAKIPELEKAGWFRSAPDCQDAYDETQAGLAEERAKGERKTALDAELVKVDSLTGNDLKGRAVALGIDLKNQGEPELRAAVKREMSKS